MNKLDKSITEKYDNYIQLINSILWVKYNISGEELAQDILHDVYIILYDDKKMKCNDPFIYIYSVIKNQLCNKKNELYIKYIQPIKIKTNLTDIEFSLQNEEIKEEKEENKEEELKNYIEKIKAKAEGQYWYDKNIFFAYWFSDLTFRQLSQQTKIPSTSIYYTITNLSNKILTPKEIKILQVNKKIQKNKNKNNTL